MKVKAIGHVKAAARHLLAMVGQGEDDTDHGGGGQRPSDRRPIRGELDPGPHQIHVRQPTLRDLPTDSPATDIDLTARTLRRALTAPGMGPAVA